MPPIERRWSFLPLADWPGRLVAAGLLFIWLLMYLAGGLDWDRGVLRALYAGDMPWVPLTIFITHLGDWQFLVAVTFVVAGWFLYRGRKTEAMFLLLVTLSGRLMVTLQKISLGRVRPAEEAHLVDVTTLSFPSGHSANSMMVYLAIAILAWRGGRGRLIASAAAVLMSLTIGFSRSMLGVHWPSDVIGGWTFGILWVGLNFWAADHHWFRRRSRRME